MSVAPDSGDPGFRVALVGGGGFIGSHLAGFLLARTRWNILLVDTDFHRLSHLPSDPRLERIQGDYGTPDLLQKVASSPVVVSLAALCQPALYNSHSLSVIESNYENPLRLFRACAGTGAHLLHASTSEVYGVTVTSAARRAGAKVGAGEHPLREDDSHFVLGPIGESRWTYASAKILAERWIEAASREIGLRATVMRPFNFIGPRMDFVPGVDGEGTPRVLACFLSALREEQPMALVDGGEARRSFTWIGDACEAIFAAILRPQVSIGQVFNIGHPGNETTIRGLAQTIGSIWNEAQGRPHAEIRTVPVSARAFYGPGYADSDRRVPDIAKARSLLEWEPKVGLADALRRTVRWFIEHYGVKV